MIEVGAGTNTIQTEEAVLFAFDEFSLPFRRNLVTHLIPAGKNPRNPRIVLPKGSPGSHAGSKTKAAGSSSAWWEPSQINRPAVSSDRECTPKPPAIWLTGAPSNR